MYNMVQLILGLNFQLVMVVKNTEHFYTNVGDTVVGTHVGIVGIVGTVGVGIIMVVGK